MIKNKAKFQNIHSHQFRAKVFLKTDSIVEIKFYIEVTMEFIAS